MWYKNTLKKLELINVRDKTASQNATILPTEDFMRIFVHKTTNFITLITSLICSNDVL